jgi:hypothetical protein
VYYEVTGVEQWGKDSPSGSQAMPHKGETSRTRGVIYPWVETVVFVVRDR